MAIGRISIKVGQKGKAQPHFNYINALDKYTKKQVELVTKGHGNMPAFALDNPMRLWELADQHERANGSTYREHILSLPREFNFEQSVDFIKDWVTQEVGDKHPFSFAIHAPKASDGKQQPHCHLMICERTLDGIERPEEQFFKRYNPKNPQKGGAKKANTGINPKERKEQIKEQRQRFGDLLNEHLLRYGYTADIDMRNYQERGVEPPENLSMIEFKNRQLLKELTEKYAPTPSIQPPAPPPPAPKPRPSDDYDYSPF